MNDHEKKNENLYHSGRFSANIRFVKKMDWLNYKLYSQSGDI